MIPFFFLFFSVMVVKIYFFTSTFIIYYFLCAHARDDMYLLTSSQCPQWEALALPTENHLNRKTLKAQKTTNEHLLFFFKMKTTVRNLNFVCFNTLRPQWKVNLLWKFSNFVFVITRTQIIIDIFLEACQKLLNQYSCSLKASQSKSHEVSYSNWNIMLTHIVIDNTQYYTMLLEVTRSHSN